MDGALQMGVKHPKDCSIQLETGKEDANAGNDIVPGTYGVSLEMYPLYWTPSKEGTFCVIRLNLS